MMPNMDPRTLKSLMSKMGIKSSEVNASRVIIESDDKDIVIANPQVTKIEAQGSISFQVSGDISENAKAISVEVTEEDIDLVAEKTGVADRELIRETLANERGDIAKTILDLTKDE